MPSPYIADTSAKLVQHPKVLCTPHLGASTVEAQKRVAVEIAEQIADAVKGKPMVGLVRVKLLFAGESKHILSKAKGVLGRRVVN